MSIIVKIKSSLVCSNETYTPLKYIIVSISCLNTQVSIILKLNERLEINFLNILNSFFDLASFRRIKQFSYHGFSAPKREKIIKVKKRSAFCNTDKSMYVIPNLVVFFNV